MSSWLTFFRSRKIEEEGSNNSVEELRKKLSLNPSILQELDEEQQTHIREVFRRAQQSQKEARVVLNTKKLSRLSDIRFRGTIDENEEFFTVRDESFVQMDSLPENSSSEHPVNFTQSIKRLSRQLYRWMSSLDDDGGDILTSARKLVRFSTPLNIERNTEFAKYVSNMSHEICTLAIAESVCKTVLDQYCHWLCTVIFTAVHNELELKYGIDAEIDKYCSELTIGIFKCVYMNAVELLCGRERLHATWSRNDRDVHIALLRASSTTFKKSISYECIQSLAHLIDQESALHCHSEFDDDSAEEFCYVLLEEDKEKLSQELISVLQNFAEELWIHILALVLADVVLKNQDSTLQEQFPEIILSSLAQENIQRRNKNSFFSMDDHITSDESSCSVSSDEFINEYTLLDNEKDSLHIYMKQEVDGRMSPPLTLYEVDPARDIYLNPLLTDVWETKKLRPVFRSNSGSEDSETEWNTRQQYDSECYNNECFYVEKSTSTAKLSIDGKTGNAEVMKYIEQIIKEAESIVSHQAPSKTTQNAKIIDQERNIDNLEFDLMTGLQEWSSSTLSAMIHHSTTIFDNEIKLEHHTETDLSKTLKSKDGIDNQEMQKKWKKEIEKGHTLLHHEALSDLTTETANNYTEDEDNVQATISFPNRIHKDRNKQIPLEPCYSPDEDKISNISRLMSEMAFQDFKDKPIWQSYDFKDGKVKSCNEFDKGYNTEEAPTQFVISEKLKYEDNSIDLFKNDLDKLDPVFRNQKLNLVSAVESDDTDSIASDFLDQTYSNFDMVIRSGRNKDEQSFMVEKKKWGKSASEEIGKKLQIQENLKESRKSETKSDLHFELTMAEITEDKDQETCDLQQIDLENRGAALGVLHLINKRKHKEIKCNDFKVKKEEWKAEPYQQPEANQNHDQFKMNILQNLVAVPDKNIVDQKFNSLYSLMINAVNSQACIYETEAKKSANSSTFKPDLTISGVSKYNIIADNSRQPHIKQEVEDSAEETFGGFQTLQSPETKLPIDEDLIEVEDVKLDYFEKYDLEENQSEIISEQSKSTTSSATSGPDSQPESVDIQNMLQSDDMVPIDDMRLAEDVSPTGDVASVIDMVPSEEM
ncbi:unnamed protein product, partial [Onchocerca ochengi]|uniref:SH2 domain-containing protein n=1 Tax=Onchocerca ochengi TaxID=42157 RepID=A0A182EEX1_ONCOC